MITSFHNYISENLIPNKDYFPSKTSVKQVALGLKYMVEMGYSKKGYVNLDYGGGRFELGTEYMKEHGVTNLVYDIYSRDSKHNINVINKILDKEPDTVTLLNVLNVIYSKSERLYVVEDAYSYLKVGGYMLIMIYIGTGKEPGLSKSRTWQENRDMKSYLPEIHEAIPNLNHQIIRMTSRMLLIRKTEYTKESIKDILKPKSEEDILKSIDKLSDEQKLLKSAQYGITWLVKDMLDKGVNPNYSDNSGFFTNDAFKLALGNGHKEIIELLLNNDNFHFKNSSYIDMVINICVRNNMVDILKIILDSDKMLHNYDVFSLISYLKHNKQNDLIILLLNYQYVIDELKKHNLYHNTLDYLYYKNSITENIRTKKGSLIKRYRNVGKLMGDDLYFHKNYVSEYIDPDFYNKTKYLLPNGFDFNIIKYNEKYGTISFIDSPDFDTSDEPIVGDSYKVTTDGRITYTRRKNIPQIYHHKWLFVKDDYSGFDVEKSKERSKKWLEYSDRINMSKIGYKNYWEDEVLPLIK